MKELSKKQTQELLENYRTWALDDPPDFAEVDYYVACPDFVDIIKWGPRPAYDDRQAWLVEEVMRTMHGTWEYKIIQRYYGWGWTQGMVAKWLEVSTGAFSQTYLPAAEDAFARNWANFFVDAKKKPWA